MRVSDMLARDSVKGRVESTGGISLAELCYQAFQVGLALTTGWVVVAMLLIWCPDSHTISSISIAKLDALCSLGDPINGATSLRVCDGCPRMVGRLRYADCPHSGIDLVRRVCGVAVHGVTVPLVTNSRGEKLGKSAGNAIWLDPAK
jgi:hypothetical protein